MTLTVQMDEELARKLADEARRQGVDPQEYARRLIEEKVGGSEPADKNCATLNLLAAWDREDATDDPAEIARRALLLAPEVDSVCVHGDGPTAVAAAVAVRRALGRAGLSVRAFS